MSHALHSLPAELIVEIALKLPVTDIVSMFLVNRKMYEVLDGKFLWNLCVQREFPWFPNPMNGKITYKDAISLRRSSKRIIDQHDWQYDTNESSRKQELDFQAPLSSYLCNIVFPYLSHYSTKVPKSTILLTGKPGNGKTYLLTNILKNCPHSLTVVRIYARELMGMDVKKLEELKSMLAYIAPVILVLEELECLSRRSLLIQEHLLDYVMKNNISKSGICIICVSQSPERFSGQYPQGKWNLLFQSQNSFIVNLHPHTMDDYQTVFAKALEHYDPFLSNGDIRELANLSLQCSHTVSDILCFSNLIFRNAAFSERNRICDHPRMNQILVSIGIRAEPFLQLNNQRVL